MKQYISQLRNVWVGVKPLTKKSHRNRLSLLLEFLYCYFRYGCLPRQYINGNFWNKRANDRKDILTYRRFVKVMTALNQNKDIHVLENKAHFNKFFSEYIHRDWLLSSESSPSQISEFMRQYGTVIIKPVDAMEGHGIYKLDISTINNVEEIAEKLAKQGVMVEEILIQHPQMIFGNTSVNTIRVHTIVDRKGKGHVLSCVLRAGVGDTVVDNYCSGGAIYPVDVNLGIVTGKGKSRIGDDHIIHPSSEIVMPGYRIPNWNILIKETIKAAEKIPNIRLVGWDVAITQDGIALIEGNHNPDYEFYEFIGDGKSYPEIKSYI